MVAKQNPWLLTCLNKMDVTDIGNIFDVSGFIKAEAKKQASQSKRTQKATAQSAVSKGSGKPVPKHTVTTQNTVQKPPIAQNAQAMQKKTKGKGISL